MPLAHFSKLYSIDDAKIDKVTADPAGGSTTYGTLYDVPGIREAGLEGDVNVSSLRGDNVELDVTVSLSSVTLNVQHAKLHLDILAVLIGGAVTDAGTTPNQTSAWLLTDPSFSPFRFRGITPANGSDFVGGAVLLTAYKCILASFPALGRAMEDYRIVSFAARCFKRLSDGKHVEETFQETRTAIV